MRPEELGELAATRDFWSAAPPELRAELHVDHAEIGGAVAVGVGGIPALLVNHVMGLGLVEPTTDAAVEEIDAFFLGLGVRYQIAVSPHARPGNLTDLLEDRGFHPGYHWQKFSRGVEPPPDLATDLRVADVGPAGAADFAQAFVAGYELPPVLAPWFAQLPGRPGWHCFVGYDGAAPVAAGALYVTGAVGWIGMAGTAPAFRGRGGHGAILAARIRRGAEAGCETLTTETGVLEAGRARTSYDNIERVGFRPTYVRENWVSPAHG